MKQKTLQDILENPPQNEVWIDGTIRTDEIDYDRWKKDIKALMPKKRDVPHKNSCLEYTEEERGDLVYNQCLKEIKERLGI